MFRFVAVALLALTTVSVNAIDFGRCDMVGNVVSVTVTGCTRTPCILKKGETYDIDVQFAPANSGNAMTYDLVAKVGIFTIPIVNGDACSSWSVGCPYTAGTLGTHRTTMTIGDQFIETAAQVILKFIDEKDRAEVCITADVEIVA